MLYTRFCKQTIEQEFNYIKITVFHNKIAQNHVVAHFRHETIAKQFDLKNVWIFSSPLVLISPGKGSNSPFSRHLISHAMLFEAFALYGHFLTLTHTQTQ
jgi:hypothetical protein